MKWTDIATGKTHSAFQQFMVALGDKAEVAVERMNAEPVFADRLADYALNGGVEPATNQKRARDIMGKGFFGIEEAISHFGVNPTRRQLAVLSAIPATEAELERFRNTHVLRAVFPLSTIEIRNRTAKVKMPDDQRLFAKQDWYDKEPFATEQGETSWQLVCKTKVANSTSLNWTQQQALIGKDDEVPTLQVMVYTIISHFLVTGERLFEKLYVRTSSVYSDGSRVHLGRFGSEGLDVSRSWDGHCTDDLGVASARKF
ncbi:MAG: hypothetical protein NTW11_02535 [Candidatus Staskawiczbacteria bacterium]|nr:hypothetical protein [Candidatus Staskawiczbacteria bacterium]